MGVSEITSDLQKTTTHVHQCKHCDQRVSIPALTRKQRAMCPRCGSLILAGAPFSYQQLFCLSLTALILLFIALPFQFITINAGGHETIVSLLDSLHNVYERDKAFLATFVFLVVIGVPITATSSSICIFFILWTKRASNAFPFLFKLFHHSREWLMAEVFIIGVLVSLIKIISMAHIHLGISFYLYSLFVVITMITLTRVNSTTLWDHWARIDPSENNLPKQPTTTNVETISTTMNDRSCDHCGYVCFSTVAQSPSNCPRCGHKPHHRPASISNTLALLITSTLLLVPANTLPVMSTYYFGEPTHSTILSGVVTFAHHGDYFIAAVIFLASVVIPLAKILALSYLCWCVHFQRDLLATQKTRLYQITEALGKWSMIDVFVVVIMVTLIQVGNIIYIRSGFGIVAFSGVVISTLFAAQQFDPRLIWKYHPKQHPPPFSP